MVVLRLLIRHSCLALFIMVGVVSCRPTMRHVNYNLYYIGDVKISNPVLVEFPYLCVSQYVCPDSILYCINDSDWLYRDDVFPYIEDVAAPTIYFPHKKVSHSPCFQYGYLPYEEDSIDYNTDYQLYHFHYGINTFECYMELNVDEDCNDYDFVVQPEDYSVNPLRYREYRLVMHQKFSLLQIICLKMKYRTYLEDNTELVNLDAFENE